MSEVLEDVRKRIKEAEKQLADARDLIDRMRLAGEDTTKMLADYTVAKQRLDRYKKAFGVK